ncbi:uncharacterized protein LOC107620801 [Arachis ipaensis]|uniref:uncharacterized protein LOC107620801 n=1 Tax=Arachis ipaensis TaxID=130454 RepID=UPI0007AF1D56|nr:uncharacterized protein LOC107620801 [Arachis ipaensis]
MCPLCCKTVESAIHLFLGCELTWQVWCAWLFALGRSWAVPETLKQHFESWAHASHRKVERKRWLIGFFAVIWAIWLERNDRVFNNHGSEVVEIINRSFSLSDEWLGEVVCPFPCFRKRHHHASLRQDRGRANCRLRWSRHMARMQADSCCGNPAVVVAPPMMVEGR